MLDDRFPSADWKRGTLILAPPAGAQIGAVAFRDNTLGSLATVLPLVRQSKSGPSRIGGAAARPRGGPPPPEYLH